MTTRVTPSRKQYLDLKAQYPDCILFFRLGDFYETFDEDAELCARELDLVLTKRHENPMAGVPYHSAEGYIAQLVAKGYKVAVAEQMGDPGSSGLMEREVRRVVSAGTITEPTMLDARRNNYLVALVKDERAGKAGLAFLDITTGEFACTQLDSPAWRQHVEEELERLAPAEVIEPVREEDPETFGPRRSRIDERGFRRTPLEAYHFEIGRARRALEEHFGVRTLEGFGCADKPLAVSAAGAALAYVKETQRRDLPQLDRLVTYSTRGYMTLDAPTRRNLELTESMRGDAKQCLLGVLDETQTAMGARLLRQWVGQPLLNRDVLEARLDAVEAFYSKTAVRLELQGSLKNIADLERLTNRAIAGHAQPRDLGAIRSSLALIPEIQLILAGLLRGGLENPPEPLHPDDLDPCRELLDLLDQAIVEEPPATQNRSGFIRPEFSEELSGIIEKAKHARDWIAGLQQVERERTGIQSLKVSYNKVFGYYIEVTKANSNLVPDDYERRQTLVNAERYVTTELKEYEALVLHAEERQLDLEQRIFIQVQQQIAAAGDRLLRLSRALAHLDVFVSLAEVAVRYRYTRPRLTMDHKRIRIERGRHPVVELALKESPYISNDTLLDEDNSIHVITGPNMSGKSTLLRQVALIVLMAQIGSFVPADSAEIGLVDRVFTRVGAQDEITRGQSTFMVEMVETANLLSQGTGRSLFILDEVGRGTSTYDGLAIARAVLEYIHNHPRLQTRTLFATHYHELTVLEELLPRVKNYRVSVAEEGDKVIFLHKIEPGGVDRSYGIYVAQIAGMPKPVISRAREILADLEQERGRPAAHHTPVQQPDLQPALFASDDPGPIEQRLREVDVLGLTPIEAINLLFELKSLMSDPT
jgi:DNA mismatch repair protein MutS